MNFDVVLTCAVTGAGDTTGKNPHVPVTPAEIATAAIDAAKAGATAAHIHVRDPETGQGRAMSGFSARPLTGSATATPMW